MTRKIRAYIDQNLIGSLKDAELTLSKTSKIDWVYSDEHFREIYRGNDQQLLDPLCTLNAKKLVVQLDDDGILDEGAHLVEAPPHDLYAKFVANVEKVPIDETPINMLVARLFGGVSDEEFQHFPDRVLASVDSILASANQRLDEGQESSLKLTVNDLAEQLSEAVPLESLRSHLGTEKGKAGSVVAESPIDAVWKLISDGLPGISQGQFFGVETPDGKPVKSTFSKIVACHTVLNMIGYRTDKGVKKADKVPRILSDGRHLGFGAFCDAFITQDRKLSDKAFAIYKFLNLRARALLLARNSSS